MLLAAGLLAGMGAGLKLTNALYAAVLCAGLLTLPLPAATRARIATLFAVGAASGFALTGGYWAVLMAQRFGNPLFPQFGSLFPNPLAAPISVADTAWRPKEAWQHVLWPFLVSLDARRAGQLGLRQIIWTLVYAGFISWAVAALRRRSPPDGRAALGTPGRLVLVMVGAGFVAWMEMFGIYRYLVPIEMLSPLAVFLLATVRWPLKKAVRVSRWLLGIATLTAVAGMKTWGHGGWRDPMLHVDVPSLADAAHTTVVIAGGEPPWSWVAVGFPREVAFVQVGGNFPEGPRLRPMMEERIAARAGPVFALVTGHHDSRVDAGKPSRRDIPAENRAEREKASKLLAAYGLRLREETCTAHRAGIGASVQVFQWCALNAPEAAEMKKGDP